MILRNGTVCTPHLLFEHYWEIWLGCTSLCAFLTTTFLYPVAAPVATIHLRPFHCRDDMSRFDHYLCECLLSKNGQNKRPHQALTNLILSPPEPQTIPHFYSWATAIQKGKSVSPSVRKGFAWRAETCLRHTARSGSVWVALVVKNIVFILPIFNVSIVF